jgi:tight adherence protein B
MRGAPLEAATLAAREFIAAKLPTDRLCVTSFATKAQLLVPFTQFGPDADAALKRITVDSVQGTTLYDDVVLAADSLSEEQGRARIVIMVTDGNETLSKASLPDAIKAARKAGTAVYVIAMESKAFTPGPLKYLAQRTGGKYYGTPSPDALKGIYAQLADELRRTWRLDYITAARPGETWKVAAHVPGQGTARAELVIPETAELAGPSGLLPAFAYGRGGLAGLAFLVGMLVLLSYALVSSSTSADRLRARVQRHIVIKPKRAARKEKKERLAALAGIFLMTEKALGRTRFWLRMRSLLERADLPLKTVELFYLMVAGGIGFGFLFSMFGVSSLINLAALVAGALLPLGVVWMKAKRRLAKFEDQLPDILISIAASLKAGHSFKQGLQAIVDEGVEPAAKEFKLVLTETRLGRPLEAALADMAERVGSANLSFIVTAVSVQTQVGGSLAGLFDMVGDTVRNRQQFARKIKALTAMGRMSAYVLIALPFGLAGALTLMNPSYMAPLYDTSKGHMLIITCIVMMCIGSLFLKKIVSFKG